MKTDYMVIGRVRNSENIQRLVDGIEDKGFTCYNFLSKPTTPDSPDLPRAEQMELLESHPDFWNDPVHQDHFETDMDGLKKAETIVLLLPAGKAAHMEAGAAYGFGKKMVIIGQVENPETLYLMFTQRYPTIESFLNSI
jgi:hypothetical protein